jgi:excisionase family DNA binding protein
MSEPSRLHPDDVDAIAGLVAEAVGNPTPWMTAQEAAEYVRSPLSRIRKLTMTGDIPHEHDGRRPLYHRDELDRFIRQGGAFTP